MKKVFALVSFLLFFFNKEGICQKIHFCDTTNQWITKGHDNYGGGSAVSHFRFIPGSGDWWPLSDGSWQYYYVLDVSTSFSGTIGTTDFLVREDTITGLVYFYVTDTEYVVYNYKMTVGLTEPTEKTAVLAGNQQKDTLPEHFMLPDEFEVDLTDAIAKFKEQLKQKYNFTDKQTVKIAVTLTRSDKNAQEAHNNPDTYNPDKVSAKITFYATTTKYDGTLNDYFWMFDMHG